MDEATLEFKCGHCGKVFATLENLRAHEREAHPDRQERREEEEEQPEGRPTR
jgi:hypothetical protein